MVLDLKSSYDVYIMGPKIYLAYTCLSHKVYFMLINMCIYVNLLQVLEIGAVAMNN